MLDNTRQCRLLKKKIEKFVKIIVILFFLFVNHILNRMKKAGAKATLVAKYRTELNNVCDYTLSLPLVQIIFIGESIGCLWFIIWSCQKTVSTHTLFHSQPFNTYFID
jgi:pentose-5-phosphate-3-epimerase